MLLKYTYLLQHFDVEFFSRQDLPGYTFIIPVNEDVIGKNPALFQTLRQSKNNFCFYLTPALTQYDRTFIKEEIIQNFVRLLFLSNYLRIEGQHVFFTDPLKDAPKKFSALLDNFCFEFKKQGIKIMLVEIMQTGSIQEDVSDDKHTSVVHSSLNNYLNSLDGEDSFETFKKAFVLSGVFNKRLVVPVTDYCDYKKKLELIEKFETWITATDPFKVQLLEMYHIAVRNNELLVLENALLKTKLENSVHYLQLIRKESLGLVNELGNLRLEIHRLTQQIINPSGPGLVANSTDDPDFIRQLQEAIVAETNRANDTLNWYKKEYEVLPMWYKRAGLAIKVLTGKRTFKSLFKKSK